MKTTLIASALIALSVAASGSAFAQHDDRGDRRNDHSQQQNNDHNDGPRNDRNDHNDGSRGNDNHGNNNNNARQYHRDDMRGGGPRHDLRRGQRLNQEYRDNRYVVNDWRERRLSAPPRGQHWVRTGNDYVLAAIATGIIAQVLIGN